MSTSEGSTDLTHLLKTMTPTLHEETFVFAHVPADSMPTPIQLASAEMVFKETEGLTLILPQPIAQSQSVAHNFPCRKITLNVHSSLEAVGFLAAVTSRLAKEVQIGVNPVSGFFHDHLFVPVGKEGVVMEALKALAAEQK